MARLSFVRWQGAFHPAYKVNADLLGRTGTIANVDVMFYTDDQKATLESLAELGAEVLQVYASQPDNAFSDAIVRLPAAAVDAVAALPEVLWLGFESTRPTLDDEMSDQILAGNHPGGTPVVGYNAHLATLGVNGAGVRWAIIDTGVDYDHPDLGSHIVGGFSFPGIPAGCDTGSTPGADCSGGGHGTHVAGIVGGDATGGFTDAGGFLYGLGVAPEYDIFAMNSLSASSWPPAGGWQEHSKRAVLGSAIGGNNSWTTGEGTNHGYQASERTHDLMVRDGNFDTPGVAEPFIEVFSAGNSGPGGATLTAPKEAKNLIVTAASRNFRVGSIDTLASFSSRGPAVDGRIVPTIASPGEQIASSRNDLGGDCSTSIAGTSNLYAFCSGTSMASPHTAGAVVLLTDWWRDNHAGANPSPAMAKALLVNGAVDMGTADIPNVNEGWGRINVTNVITPPALANHWEQTTPLAATGNDFTITLGVPNPGLPVKVTLAWTDAAGAVGANPALVNNLDLTVVDGANTYKGNRFVSGWSATGGSYDTLNNLENVFIQTSSSGSIEITVAATAINGDGVPNNGDPTDQDFALVCTNCALDARLHPGGDAAEHRRLRPEQRPVHGQRRQHPRLYRPGHAVDQRHRPGDERRLHRQPGDAAGQQHDDHQRHHRRPRRQLRRAGRRHQHHRHQVAHRRPRRLRRRSLGGEPELARRRRRQPAGAAHLQLGGGARGRYLHDRGRHRRRLHQRRRLRHRRGGHELGVHRLAQHQHRLLLAGARQQRLRHRPQLACAQLQHRRGTWGLRHRYHHRCRSTAPISSPAPRAGRTAAPATAGRSRARAPIAAPTPSTPTIRPRCPTSTWSRRRWCCRRACRRWR